MTISEVLNLGRAEDNAMRQIDWPDGRFAFHGMDNIVCFDSGEPITPCVASLIATNWEMFAGASYHGIRRISAVLTVNGICQIHPKSDMAREIAAIKAEWPDGIPDVSH